jgi:uncharacterized protein
MWAVVRSLFIGLLGLAAFYLVVSVYLYTQQTRFLFFPQANIMVTPESVGLDYEDVWIAVESGDRNERLHGWWMPASRANAKTLLYFHGNGANIGANVELAGRFRRMGLSVLLFDYRGYGKSQSRFPNESRVYEDAEAAWQYLVEQRGISPENIVLFGHSMGGAIALDLAIRHPNAAGIIVQSSFTSIREMADFVPYYRIFPLGLLLTQSFDSRQKIERLQMPVLLIHGTADRMVPAQMSEALYAAAPQPKTLWMVPGAGHNDVSNVAGMNYEQVVQPFIASLAEANLNSR